MRSSAQACTHNASVPPPLDLRPLAGKPRALLRRALRRWPPAAELARAGFESLLAICESPAGGQTSIGNDTAIFQNGILRLAAATNHAPHSTLRAPHSALRNPKSEIPVPQPFTLSPLQSFVSFTLPDGATLVAELITLTAALRKRILSGKFSPAETVFIAAPPPRTPLIIRAARPGDRYRPLGAPGSAKLSDLFINRKIPRARRATLPVVCVASPTARQRHVTQTAKSADGAHAPQHSALRTPQSAILWSPGLPPADAFKITPKTSRALRLTYRDGTSSVRA